METFPFGDMIKDWQNFKKRYVMFKVFWRFKFLVLATRQDLLHHILNISCNLYVNKYASNETNFFLLLLPLIRKVHCPGFFVCVLFDLDYGCVFSTSKCCKYSHLYISLLQCCNILWFFHLICTLLMVFSFANFSWTNVGVQARF